MKDWLQLCVRSVADQDGVCVEHLICDAGSSDGTVDWLRQMTGSASDAQEGCMSLTRESGFHYRLAWKSESDRGMYDAVNKGLHKAQYPVCAYINCDEQYVPGGLARVARYFADHPSVDILFGDVIITKSDGSYLCSRQVLKPHYWHTVLCHLGTLTAAMFFRRTVLTEQNLYFDPEWRDIGDAVWVLSALSKNLRTDVLHDYAAVFFDTGANMGLKPNVDREKTRLRKQFPFLLVQSSWIFALGHRIRRLFAGYYRPRPFSYAIYTTALSEERTTFPVSNPGYLWKDRFSWRH